LVADLVGRDGHAVGGAGGAGRVGQCKAGDGRSGGRVGEDLLPGQRVGREHDHDVLGHRDELVVHCERAAAELAGRAVGVQRGGLEDAIQEDLGRRRLGELQEEERGELGSEGQGIDRGAADSMMWP
jgi:hypothetical protein